MKSAPSETQLKRTLADLVSIDSTSSKTNVAMIDYLERRLKAAGAEVERQRYTDEAGVEKVNLVGFVAAKGANKSGSSDRPELALVGHTDCVPFDPDWAQALTLTEEDGKLFARGACDTKAFIACAVEAFSAVDPLELKRPLGVIFTADEEVGCLGAKRLVEANLGGARYAIVGEPTSLTPVRAHKGYCLAEVLVEGREGHSAYPDVGASAIFRAGRFLKKLEEAALGEIRVEQDPQFQPPYTSVNVGTISGGKAKNIIPGACAFVVEWRPIPGQPVERVKQVLGRIVAELQREEPDYTATVRVLREDDGVNTPEDSQLVQFLQTQSGKTAATVPFGTEAPQLTALGAQAVVFGPGDIRVAHRTGEYVPITELVRCREILSEAIRHFCGSAARAG